MKFSNDVVCSSHPIRLIAGMVFLVFMLAAIPAFSASFDCAKARSRSEKIVCADPAISHLDEELSRMYVQAKETSADKQAITQEQRLWINSERDKCSDAPCMIQAYKTRMMQLDKTLPKNRNEAGGSNDPSTENIKSVATDASPPGKAKDGVQPDPVRWAEIERSLKKRQKDFITHLDSAKKLELSKVREPFPWQVDWPAVEKWCESIVKALDERQNVQFPMPSTSLARDGAKRVRDSLLKVFPHCGKWRSIREETTQKERMLITAMVANDKKYLSDSGCSFRNSEFVSCPFGLDNSIDIKRDIDDNYMFRRPKGMNYIVDLAVANEDQPTSVYTSSDAVILSGESQGDGMFLLRTQYGKGCADLEGLEYDMSSIDWLTEAGPYSDAPLPKTILLDIGGNLVVAVFGTYSTGSYKDIIEKMKKCNWCQPNTANIDEIGGIGSAPSNRWSYIPNFPETIPVRWGSPGQGFILISGVGDRNIWHSSWTQAPSTEIMKIIDYRYPELPVPSGYLSEWQTGFLHTCIINFDRKIGESNGGTNNSNL